MTRTDITQNDRYIAEFRKLDAQKPVEDRTLPTPCPRLLFMDWGAGVPMDDALARLIDKL